VIVVPKRHVSDYFDLAEREQQACWLLVNRVQALLRERLEADDFTVGVNLESPELQTEKHTHIHVIP
jgi:diadenosine tetraphosphate (Ap4A) HIT family hydrolase